MKTNWEDCLPNRENSAKAVYAIAARLNGVWDNPYLVECGPMTPDTISDIQEIMEHYGVA